jgi:hypothetical protein
MKFINVKGRYLNASQIECVFKSDKDLAILSTKAGFIYTDERIEEFMKRIVAIEMNQL